MLLKSAHELVAQTMGVDRRDRFGLVGGPPYGAGDPVRFRDPRPLSPAELRADKEKAIDALAAKYSERPDCSGEEGCTLITLIVEIGDPAEGFIKDKAGHAGMGIGSEFYDFGPTDPDAAVSPGIQWWDNPDNSYWGDEPPAKKPGEIGLQHMADNINQISPNLAVKIEFCACAKRTERMRKFWKSLYAEIETGNQPDWKLNTFQCSTAVMSALAVGDGFDPLPGMGGKVRIEAPLGPDSLLDYIGTRKSNCGRSKGKNVAVTKLKSYDSLAE